MKKLTDNLTGFELNWALAQALNLNPFISKYKKVMIPNGFMGCKPYNPSEDWGQCGEFIERHLIDVAFDIDDGKFLANRTGSIDCYGSGTTPQVAICRALLHHLVGDEIEFPYDWF